MYKFLSASLIALSLLLAGCDQAGESQPQKASSIPVSTATIASEAVGFTVGATMSTRTVYVFFDAQCPHCSALWAAAKPLRSQAKFVWIPVGILNAASTSQGATLLSAADPAAAMDTHEASMNARGGGIAAGNDLDAMKAAVAKNTELMTRMGFTSIPTVVGTHAQTGALVSQEGSLPTSALANLLGLRAPSSTTNPAS